MGLTGLQLLTSSGKNVDLTLDMLEANPKDLNSLPEYSKDVRLGCAIEKDQKD